MNETQTREPGMHRLVRFVGLNSLAHPLATFCISVVIARALGPDGRGAYGAVVAALTLLPIVASVGLEYAVRFWSARGQVDDGSLLKTTTVVGLVLGAAVTGLTVAYWWFGLPNSLIPPSLGLSAVAVLSAALLLTTLNRFWAEYLTGHERYGYRTWGTTAGTILQAVFLVAIWRISGLSVDAAVLCLGLQAGFVSILFLVLARHALRRAAGAVLLPLAELRKMTSYAWWLYLSSLLSQVNLQITILMLAALSDLRETGLYTAVVGVANLLLLLGVPLSTVLSARTTRRAGEPDFPHQVAVGLRLVLAVGALAAGAGALISPLALPFIFGERFEDSVLPFCLLLPGILGLALVAVISQYMMGAGRTGWNMAIAVVSATVGVSLNFALIPLYGATGAAISVSVAYFLALVLATYAFLKVGGLRFADLAMYRTSDWKPIARVLSIG